MDDEIFEEWCGKLVLIGTDLCLIYKEVTRDGPTLKNLIISSDRCSPGNYEGERLVHALRRTAKKNVACDLGKLISEVRYDIFDGD